MTDLDHDLEHRRRGTGKWAQPDVPHRGWSCLDVEDLGEPSATCEMCEHMQIRYLHYMQHPDHAELAVGCVCAEHMEGDYVGPRRREARLKSRVKQRQRFVEREWNRSRAGNEYVNADGYNVTVFPRGDGFGSRIVNDQFGVKVFSRRVHPTSDAAKREAFDAMMAHKDITCTCAGFANRKLKIRLMSRFCRRGKVKPGTRWSHAPGSGRSGRHG
jgi:hypothetical protein